jgi:hypothetical protein
MKRCRYVFVIILFVYAQNILCQGISNPDFIVNIQNDLPLDQIRGEYGVWYKRNLCSYRNGLNHANKITKPFILCEGFDVTNGMKLTDIYGQTNGNSPNNFLDQLRYDGYDIIILNLHDNTKSITKNSRLLQKLITNINAEVELNSQTYGTLVYRPVVGGISMGGLIARHALMTMEKNGIDHKVEKLITFDTPNQGANVPLGLGNLANVMMGGPVGEFQQFRSIMSKFGIPDPLTVLESIIIRNWETTFHYDAAFEMIMNYSGPNPDRTLFLAEMNSLGNYPTKPRLVGIANGANMQKQNGLNAGDYLMDWHKDIFCIVNEDIPMPFGISDIHVRVCPLTFGTRVWAMPGNNLGQIMLTNAGSEIGIDDNFANTGITRYSWDVTHRDIVNAPITRDWNVDHVPGGYYSMGNLGFGNLQGWLDEQDINWRIKLELENVCDPLGVLGCINVVLVDMTIKIENLLGTLSYAPQFSFVPTVSALDINTHNWNYNVASLSNYPHNKSITPFDAIYWNTHNSNHAFMEGYEMANFSMSEVSPNYLYIQDRIFDADYKHTFEARKYIAVGKDVDQVAGRSNSGDVIIKNGTHIKFSIEDDQFVYFDDGVDIQFGAEVEVIENNLSSCSGKNLSSATQSPNPNWQTLRVASVVENEEKLGTEGREQVTKEINMTEPIKYNKFETTANAGQINHVSVLLTPNPALDFTRIIYKLPKRATVSINVFNAQGILIATPIRNEVIEVGSYIENIDTSNWSDGFYLITTAIDGAIHYNKLIVRK